MNHRLSKFQTQYKTKLKYWYIVPRAMYFNDENLIEMQDVLQKLKELQFDFEADQISPELPFANVDKLPPLRKWNQKTKKNLFNSIVSSGIIKPTASSRNQTVNDQLANLRNHFNLFSKLGLARFNSLSQLYISEMGERFIDASNIEDLKEVLENQLCKLQFWNPSLNHGLKEKELETYKHYKVHPYLFILRTLIELEDPSISLDEYMLFLSWRSSNAEVKKAMKDISLFRKLTEEQQKKTTSFLKTVDSRPLRTQADVTLGLFGSTLALTFDKGKLRIVDFERANALIDKFKNSKYVNFESYEDWFSAIGNSKDLMSSSDIVEYYVDRAKTENIDAFIDDIEDQVEKKSLNQLVHKFIKERHIEDILSANLYLLDIPNLRLVKNGRQYKTDVSTIDLLAEDNNGYVVIELKKEKADDESVGQILRYVGWVKKHLSPQNDVRGVIVLAYEKASVKLKYALHGLQNANVLITCKELESTE